jgi:hypothetical protein
LGDGLTSITEEQYLAIDRAAEFRNSLAIHRKVYDRRVEFQNYRTIDSLKDHILVAQDSVRVDHYTRSVDNTWTLRDHQTVEDELKIASIGISLPLGRIYDRVELPPAA